MQKRHADLDQYFQEQGRTTEKYVIPYINEVAPVSGTWRVAEIGCGEAGNLMPFMNLGCICVGVDIDAHKVEKGRELYRNHPNLQQLTLLIKDIYHTSPQDVGGPFDLIILRDVIEHIPHQSRFLSHLKLFLKPSGSVFFGFPPWRMPFGGHQQAANHRWLSKIPYTHLLPESLYLGLWRWGGESEEIVQALKDIRQTGISINRFRKIVRENGYHLQRETLFLINPNYEVKFGLRPRVLPFFLNIPWLRDFFTTAVYALIREKSV